MDFFFLLHSFFVVTDISPHFPGIKNPFWIIHSILNLAGTCIHNKFNLLRRFWDLSWMCQWQTTKILSFIFNTKATGRVTSSRISKALSKNGQHCFWTFSSLQCRCYMNIEYAICHITYEMVPRPYRISYQNRDYSTELPPVISTKTERGRLLISSWLPRQWGQGNSTVGGILSVHHMTCLKSLKRSPLEKPEICLISFYFSLSLKSELSPFCGKQLFFIRATRSPSANLSSAWCNLQKWGENCVLWSQVLLCNIRMAELPFCGSKHNTWSNYEATIIQARPDVIDRPSDSRVRGKCQGSRFSFSLTLCVYVYVCLLGFFCPLEEDDADS